MSAQDLAISPRDRIALLFEIARSRPGPMALSVFCLLISAILDGIGVLALLPAIGVVLEGSAAASNPHPVVQAFAGLFEWFGLSMTIEVLLLFILTIVVSKAAITLVAQIQVSIAQSQSVEATRRDLISELLRARWEFFTRQPTGRLSNAIANESQSSGQLYSQFADIVATTLQTVAYLTSALLISWQVTFGALIVGFAMLLLLSRFIGSTQRNSLRLTNLMSGFSARLVDSMMGMKPLKAMGMAGRLQPILHKDIHRLRLVLVKLLLLKKFLLTAQEVIRAVALVAVIYVFTRFNPTSIEGLLTIAFVFLRTLEAFGRFQKQWQSITQTVVPYRHVRGLIAYARANPEPDRGEIDTVEFRDKIRFEDVGFSYAADGGEATDLYFRTYAGDAPTIAVLQNMNLEISAGDFVCLLGSSGAGKTTLADLLIGLITPQEGRILVDDQPLGALRLDAWRRSIGYVPQDVFLFNGTIRDNITMGDEAFTQADIDMAVSRAGAGDFIAEVEGDLDAPVGERGVTLSGGQRQRICIARALIRNPRLLILDEATSALDSRTEQDIAATVRSLTPDVTVVAITHRPALADIADVVVRIADGAVEDMTDQRQSHTTPAAVEAD